MSALKVLSVVSELYPLIKTGGLADVAGALPGALAAHEVEVRTVVPGYPSVMAALEIASTVVAIEELWGGPARVLAGKAAGLELFVVDAPHLYARPGSPYQAPGGADWQDNAVRFAALSWIAAQIAMGAVPAFVPDVVHTHDWQTGLVAAYLTYDGRRRPGVVTTIHNIAFQGRFPASLMPMMGLPSYAFGMEGIEYYGGIGFLKASLRFADRITTVSPTYADEILTPENGMGLEGLLNSRRAVVSGILNGIDDTVWNPATDPLLPAHYTVSSPLGRRLVRTELCRRFGLVDDPKAIVFGVVSRLSWQKGLDLVLAGMDKILALGGQLVLLGSGDADLTAGFQRAASTNPGRIGCTIGYDESLAHLIQGGSDVILVPSRFEPCGLTQLCALRYGAIPLVSRVGGLADTIIEANEMAIDAGTGTGVVFSPLSQEQFEGALTRVARLHADPTLWRRLMRNAMKTDVSWSRSAGRYADLYRGLVVERGA
ncbi:glycogen synthase GlgA [Siculibacillus lacustris]|uniref:Glycogen synthase n=1 Tax=Siculibacillus lacustris TaxID=1549641 RepID=A0A4V2KSN8_9HYPH|nr:glycogen synthase GlgA [Siculibacillus lacustris]TBW33714.1 glycogen synthase GlgA [Siculibacillus lacustris]